MASGESPPYREKYVELFQIWQDQEKYIEKKCLDIEYQDKYIEFLMEQYEIHASEIIALKKSVGELKTEVNILREEIIQLKVNSANCHKRCDYLENLCCKLRDKNRQLSDLVQSLTGDSHDSTLNSTFTIDDAYDEVSLTTPPRRRERRADSGMSGDFRDDLFDLMQSTPANESIDRTDTPIQDFPVLFDAEIFTKDGSSLSYEDSDGSFCSADENSDRCEKSVQPSSSKPSRLNWIRKKIRSNKIMPSPNTMV
ncbi:uncharacterized protein LOC135478007 [Liolophura sinensis]|uniref:uncharacterized protein LOC135478007 n=1 Tax=Liolophura sinensis TaxID=3198878 RepID=UPI0031589C8F